MKKNTLTNIAKKLGVTPQFMWMIASGVRKPNWKRAKQLSAIVPGTTAVFWMESSPDQIRSAIKNTGHIDSTNHQDEAAA